jgi:hypothetical protein
MEGSILLSSVLDEALPWVLATLTIVLPASAFLIFLWSFRGDSPGVPENHYVS